MCTLGNREVALAADVASAAPAANNAEARRPRVALVLSGGGARGLAHIGVIRELERLQIPVDCIAGTSMGGVIGGIYASGLSIDEIESQAKAIDWAAVFQDRPDRSAMRSQRKKDQNGHFAQPEFGVRDGGIVSPAGMVYGQNLAELMNRLTQRATGITRFDQLPIPFRAVATDITSGTAVVLERGQLPLALRATMSIPAVLAPVELDGDLLVDGGLVNNLPVAIGRALCGEVVIAVNLGTPLLTRKDIGSALSVGVQMVNILTEQNVRASLASLSATDVLITPQLDAFSAGSFDQAEALIAAGQQAVRDNAGMLARLAVGKSAFANWKQRHDLPDLGDPTIGEVRVSQLRVVTPEAMSAELAIADSEQRASTLIAASKRLFEKGDFERIQISFGREDGREVATIDAKEKSWGPDYLRFGLSLTAQSGESTAFNAVAGYTRTWLNQLGARWQTILQLGETNALHSEFFQPLGAGSPLFIAPRLLFNVAQSPVYLGDTQVARVTRNQAQFALEVGTEFGRNGEMRIGAQMGQEKYNSDVSAVAVSTSWSSVKALTARLNFDTLDKAHFPTNGYLAVVDLHRSFATGADNPGFQRRSIDLSAAETWGRNTYNVQFMAAKISQQQAAGDNLFDLISLGGFQRLSAYPINRFRVNQAAFGRIGYQRNIAPLLGLTLGGIITQTYFGGSLEFAKLRQNYDSATPNGLYKSAAMFVGADTVLGPASLSFGVGSGGQRAIWLSIGVPWTLH